MCAPFTASKQWRIDEKYCMRERMPYLFRLDNSSGRYRPPEPTRERNLHANPNQQQPEFVKRSWRLRTRVTKPIHAVEGNYCRFGNVGRAAGSIFTLDKMISEIDLCCRRRCFSSEVVAV
jgi:hypothetical protein